MKRLLVLALLLASCGSIATPPRRMPTTVEVPQGELVAVGFYVSNLSPYSVNVTSWASCGPDPIDPPYFSLLPGTLKFTGGIFYGCLIGSDPGYVLMTVTSPSDTCVFKVQVKGTESEWYSIESGVNCSLEGGSAKDTGKGNRYEHLIFGQSG